ncbi:energy-coupling factor transporter transmembrane component T [Moorellaceae bacterium AZ2]
MLLYTPGDSILHRMDAITKLVWLFSTGALVLVTARPEENFVIFSSIVLIAVFLARIPFLALLKRISVLFLVGIWLLVLMSVLYPDKSHILKLGPLAISREGLAYGITLFFRLLVLGTSSIVFAHTTDPARMVNELIEIMHLPYRYAYAAYAALRFLPMIQAEARTIMNAHAIRGMASKDRSLRGRFNLIQRLTIPLIVGAIRRVQITAIAMDSRAFGAYPRRTCIDPIKMPISGFILAGIYLATFLFYFVWRFFIQGGDILRTPIF